MVKDWKPIIAIISLMLAGLMFQAGDIYPEEMITGDHTVSTGSSDNLPVPSIDPPPTRANLKPAPRIEDLKYVAIGRSKFEDELRPLLDWKTQKGVKAVFFSLEDVNASYYVEGKDTPEVVRDFLKSLKQRNPRLDWVLLAGDGEDIPPRDVFVNGSAEIGWDDPDNYVPTDMYYAGLDLVREDGDWDLNDNGIYGEDFVIDDKKFEEKDFNADVYVGRFPASTEKEMSTIVRKQLAYELDPPPGSWASSMLLSGSLMDVPNDPFHYQPYKDNAYELVLKVEEDLPDHVTPFHLVDYPQIDYGGYNVMFDTLNRSSFGSYYEAGFSTVLIACHGDTFNGNCTNYKGEGGGKWSYIRDYEDHFTYDMAGTIQNGERLPLVYISSCGSTPFQEEDDTNMERLLTNPDGGAIALIGATVDTYRGEFRPNPDDPNSTYSFGNWWLAQEFFQLLHSGTVRPGKALYDQKWNYRLHLLNDLGKTVDIDLFSKTFNVDTLAYNLMGDPEGPLWLDEPKEMKVTIPTEFDYEQGFTVFVNDTRTGPLHGAVVTLTDPREPDLFYSVKTGADGVANLQPALTELGDLRIVVTMDGYIPIISPIKSTSSWDIALDPEVTFDPDPPIFGEPFRATFTISTNINHSLNELLLFWSWYNTTSRLPMNKTLTNFTINETREFKTDELHWKNGDYNTMSAWIFLFPEKLESNDLNNRAVKDFTVNQPIVMNLMDRIKIDEDRSFSEMYGIRLDLIDLKKVVDLDGPKPITIAGEVAEEDIGNISLDQDLNDQTFDIIPAIDWSGEAEILFHADDGSKFLSGTVIVEVMEVPDQPKFLEIPTFVNGSEDSTNNFTVVLYDIDSEELNLSTHSKWVNIMKEQGGHTSTFLVKITPTDQFIGETFLTFTASDGVTNDVNLTIIINVSATNDPPRIISPLVVNVTKGHNVEIDLLVEDPDGDLEFNITVEWGQTTHYFEHTSFILPVPPDADIGEHIVTITIDDGNNNGTTTYQLTVNIEEEESEDYSLVLIVLIAVIFSFLLVYGVFLRFQERKQKRMLDSVGTNAPLEARPLSEKDFKKRTSRKKREEGLPMPPAPLEVEGALARKGSHVDDEDEPGPLEQDLESDIDDILSEMYG